MKKIEHVALNGKLCKIDKCDLYEYYMFLEILTFILLYQYVH